MTHDDLFSTVIINKQTNTHTHTHTQKTLESDESKLTG